MLKRLEQRFRHCCMNCKYFQPYGVINEGEVDCEINHSPEYYWNYYESNDCEQFEYVYRSWRVDKNGYLQ